MWTGKYQLNMFDPAEHDWGASKNISHLRNRFQLKFNKKSTKIEPYVFYEFFVPLNVFEPHYFRTDAYRIAGGAKFDINKENSLKVFVMYEKEKKARYDIQNYIYGIAYTVDF